MGALDASAGVVGCVEPVGCLSRPHRLERFVMFLSLKAKEARAPLGFVHWGREEQDVVPPRETGVARCIVSRTGDRLPGTTSFPGGKATTF